MGVLWKVLLLLAAICSVFSTALPATERRRRKPGPPPPPPAPPFDGRARPCGTDPSRVDAYMIPPPCPAGVPECTDSSNHCNFLEATPAGLALAWFSGYKEGWDHTGIVVARLAPNSSQWSAPAAVSSQEGYSAQNPILYADLQASKLYAWHTRQPKGNKQPASNDDPVPSQERYGVMWLSESEDWGATWGAASLWEPRLGSWGRNRLIGALDGSLMFPIYNESLKPLGHDKEYSLLLRKPRSQPVEQPWASSAMGNTSYLVQPSVIRPVPGQPGLRAFFRDRRAESIYTSTSPDDGATWSPPTATSLPNNNAGISAIVLKSGAVVIAFNNMRGQTSGNLRNVLAVAVSYDHGASFEKIRTLEQHSGAARPELVEVGGVGPTSCDCYSYPNLLQTADGKIHIGYTYQRRTIKVTTVDEAWISAPSPVLCSL